MVGVGVCQESLLFRNVVGVPLSVVPAQVEHRVALLPGPRIHNLKKKQKNKKIAKMTYCLILRFTLCAEHRFVYTILSTGRCDEWINSIDQPL